MRLSEGNFIKIVMSVQGHYQFRWAHLPVALPAFPSLRSTPALGWGGFEKKNPLDLYKSKKARCGPLTPERPRPWLVSYEF